MNEFFAGQIEFQLHPACDALYHIKNTTPTSPFSMKSVEENIAFLEYTSPSSITVPADTSYYTDHKTTVYVTKKQLEVVEYISKFTGHYLKSLLSKPGNTSYLRLITINYKIEVDQVVSILQSLYRHAVTNQRGRDVPFLCKKFYTLQPCTFEAGVHYLELVQAALHRHKYTYFSDFNCDVMQLILCLYSGNLKKNLIDSSKRANLTWSELKQEADIIVSTLKEAGQSLYDPLPSGKNVPQFQPAVSPLSPPLKSGSKGGK